MRWAAINLIVLSVSLMAPTAIRAQSVTAPPRPVRPLEMSGLELLPPVTSQTASELSDDQPQGEYVAPPVAHPLASAASPPEPAPANWGDYTQPRPVRPAFPALAYDLAGPPPGFVQPDSPPAYQRVFGDPNGILATDASLTQGIDLVRPDGIAPIGVHGDHTLHAGQMLFSVRYDQESFDDNFVSSQRVSTASILANFPYAPRRLFQNRETALFDMAATEDFTLLMTLPFEHSRLDYLTASGSTPSTSFGNPGDVTITGLYVLYRRPGQQLHLNFGLNVPTGFLDYQNVQPSPTFPNLPYVIRTSSRHLRSVARADLSRTKRVLDLGRTGFGRRALGLEPRRLRSGRPGGFDGLVVTPLDRAVGASVRIDGQGWGNVRGADPRLNTSLSPTNRPDMQGGTRLNLLFGINYFLPRGANSRPVVLH